MKVLKGLGLGLLGFLLYVSLSTFALVFMMNSTVLNPQFVASEIGRLDISAIAKDVIRQQFQLPPEIAKFAMPLVDETLVELKPWINQQVNTAIYSGYDYLLGKSQEFKITIQTEPAKEAIKKNLRKALLESPPPELQQLPQAMRDQLLNQIEQQFSAQIPSTFTVDRSMIGADGMTVLQQARQVIGYIQSAYTWLIALIVILALGIALIHHQVRGATRALGITSLTCGVINYASFFLLNYLAPTQIPQAGLPAQLGVWLTQFITDLVAPVQTFNLALVAIGVVLLIVSFVYGPSSAKA